MRFFDYDDEKPEHEDGKVNMNLDLAICVVLMGEPSDSQERRIYAEARALVARCAEHVFTLYDARNVGLEFRDLGPVLKKS